MLAKMAIREINEKYRNKGKARRRLNAYLRDECPGANELLDLLEQVSGMRQKAAGHTLDLLDDVEDGLQAVRDAMVEAMID
jgi:hypothetical protein